ncbi:hypothetical protein CPC08DRAFT_602449, partial [Agrocybe pediades]
MHTRFYRERLHVINSFDAVLFQLHTLSFFLSPSLWLYTCRLLSQIVCARPREIDSSRSLRFFYFIVFTFNVPNIWSHSTRGVMEGRAIILDFIGMSYQPSKLQLLCLDLLILFLQLVTITISYETSLYDMNKDVDPQDTLLPGQYTPLSIPLFTSSIDSPVSATTYPPSPALPSVTKPMSSDLPLILDLRIAPILTRLRHPPPTTSRPADSGDALLHPNMAPWPLPGIGILMRAGRNMR